MNLCGYVGRYVDMYVGRKVCRYVSEKGERKRESCICVYL